jgi:hypothetical protein
MTIPYSAKIEGITHQIAENALTKIKVKDAKEKS